MTMVKAVKQIAAGEFKTHCLRLLDEIASEGGEYVVTKRGVPVARVVPLENKPVKREPPKELEGTLLWFDRPFDPILDPMDEKIFPHEDKPQP